MAALRAPAPVRRQDRTTTEVILDHLDCRRRNALDDDLARNYAGEVTVISRRGASAGPSAVRTEAAFLGDVLPDMRFRVTSLVASGPYAYLVWSARGRGARVDEGVDTFVVERGRIVCQTVHYVVQPGT